MDVELEDISGQQFNDATLPLDGRCYTDCTFRDCRLRYAGTGHFMLPGCTLTGKTTIELEGPALLTVQSLALAYGNGLHDWVEGVIGKIRAPFGTN